MQEIVGIPDSTETSKLIDALFDSSDPHDAVEHEDFVLKGMMTVV